MRRAPRRATRRSCMPLHRREGLIAIACLTVCFFALTFAYELGALPQALPGLRRASFPGAAAHELRSHTGASLVAIAAETLSALREAATAASTPYAFHGALVQNVSVVMPCFGQSQFLEEGLASVIHQLYPPVEILVIDDGSEDRCGALASKILGSTLAAPRQRQVALLQKWWGWGAAEMATFRDEVVVTPNRGVAHARNVGIRRARGNWIMCLDADDMITEDYIDRAMKIVAAEPTVNMIYAKQQFFGESRWQWTVPELRVDDAIVRGPLPLMTLFRKELWEATPYGFDEALPKGHEDWAFWLQLTRLPLQSRRIDAFLTLYRYKKNSKMRNRERSNPEVPRLLRCLFPDLYPVRKLLIDHHELLKPNGFTESVVMDVSVSQHLHPLRAAPHLWSGMILEAKRDEDGAVRAYNRSRAVAKPFDWQPTYRLWRLHRRRGDAAAASEARDALVRLWGEDQFAWYTTDVDGDVVKYTDTGDGASRVDAQALHMHL